MCFDFLYKFYKTFLTQETLSETLLQIYTRAVILVRL